MPDSRRRFLKAAGSIGIAGSMVGCLGGGGGSQASPTSTATAELDPNAMGQAEYAESWRERASERAAEELSDKKLNFLTSFRSDVWKDTIENHDYSGVYEPLRDSIIMSTLGSDTLETRYARQYAAGGQMSFSIIDFSVAALVAQGIEFSQIDDIPGYIEQPDDVQFPPFTGASTITGFGVVYNTELVSDPPQTREDLLAPRFADKKILLDWTPSVGSAGPVLLRQSDQWFEDFVAQKPIYGDSTYGVVTETGKGNAHVGFLGMTLHVFRFTEQMPLAPVMNPAAWTFRPQPLSLALRPRLPWASRLLMDWLLRPDNDVTPTVLKGTMAPTFDEANPPEVLDLFDPENYFTEPQLVDAVGTPPDEMMKAYQKKIGAPQV